MSCTTIRSCCSGSAAAVISPVLATAATTSVVYTQTSDDVTEDDIFAVRHGSTCCVVKLKFWACSAQTAPSNKSRQFFLYFLELNFLKSWSSTGSLVSVYILSKATITKAAVVIGGPARSRVVLYRALWATLTLWPVFQNCFLLWENETFQKLFEVDSIVLALILFSKVFQFSQFWSNFNPWCPRVLPNPYLYWKLIN